MLKCLYHFESFLSKHGIVSKKELQLNSLIERQNNLVTLSVFLNKNHKTKTPFEISSKIYDQYISNDDRHLKKLLRRLLPIYSRRRRVLKLKAYYHWKLFNRKPKPHIPNPNTAIVSKRLYEDSKHRWDYLQMLEKKFRSKEDIDCTFTPRINHDYIPKMKLSKSYSNYNMMKQADYDTQNNNQHYYDDKFHYPALSLSPSRTTSPTSISVSKKKRFSNNNSMEDIFRNIKNAERYSNYNHNQPYKNYSNNHHPNNNINNQYHYQEYDYTPKDYYNNSYLPDQYDHYSNNPYISDRYDYFDNPYHGEKSFSPYHSYRISNKSLDKPSKKNSKTININTNTTSTSRKKDPFQSNRITTKATSKVQSVGYKCDLKKNRNKHSNQSTEEDTRKFFKYPHNRTGKSLQISSRELSYHPSGNYINYAQANHVTLQTLSDAKLLQLATHYVTTDESLEKFKCNMIK